MADLDLVRRVEKLEETVDSLRDLPERTTRLEVRLGTVETQIVHLRDEMHSGFSATQRDIAAVRTELKEESAATRTELKGELAAVRTELKGEIAAVGTDLKGEIAAVRTEFAAVRIELREDIADLSRDVAARILEMGTQIQVQIEGLHSVIATTREGNPPAN